MTGEAVAGGAGLVVLLAAWRLRWLAPPAVAAALGVGAAVLVGTGAAGLTLLLAFFVSASLLTRAGGSRKEGRGPEHAPGRARGRRAGQVVANGGVAAAAALAALAGWEPAGHYAVVGALAAATADTWATEVGTWAAGPTRLLTTWERVPPGRSGGVSLAGTAAGVAGAMCLGFVAGLAFAAPGASEALGTGSGAAAGVRARAPGVPGAAAWAGVGLVAGTAGMVADSVLGATLEARVRWIDNDVVNLAGTLAGAAVALLAAGWAAP